MKITIQIFDRETGNEIGESENLSEILEISEKYLELSRLHSQTPELFAPGRLNEILEFKIQVYQ